MPNKHTYNLNEIQCGDLQTATPTLHHPITLLATKYALVSHIH
jgi:hypothetical protein